MGFEIAIVVNSAVTVLMSVLMLLVFVLFRRQEKQLVRIEQDLIDLRRDVRKFSDPGASDAT